jgi:hypothetical protein
MAIQSAWEQAEPMCTASHSTNVASTIDPTITLQPAVSPDSESSSVNLAALPAHPKSLVSLSGGFLPSPSPPQAKMCAPWLQELCPLCFGGNTFGRSFTL